MSQGTFSTLDCIPKEILKIIVSHLSPDNNSIRTFLSTYPKAFRLYTLEERYTLYTQTIPFKIDGKILCRICGLYVYSERYESHLTRCVRIQNLPREYIANCRCKNKCKHYSVQESFPWHLKRKPCPFFKCIYCKGDVEKNNNHKYSGCTSCKLYACNMRHCLMCDCQIVKCQYEDHTCISDDLKYLKCLIESIGEYRSVEIWHDLYMSFVLVLEPNGNMYRFVPINNSRLRKPLTESMKTYYVNAQLLKDKNVELWQMIL